MNAIRCYTEVKFGIFIDNSRHGSGLRLVNTKAGAQLEIRRTSVGSGNLNCHVFVIRDARLSLFNGQLDSIQY